MKDFKTQLDKILDNYIADLKNQGYISGSPYPENLPKQKAGKQILNLINQSLPKEQLDHRTGEDEADEAYSNGKQQGYNKCLKDIRTTLREQS